MDRIDIYATARSGARWEGRLALAALPRLCASLTDGPGDRDALLEYACRGFIDSHGRPALDLHLETVLPVRCDRCGQKLALVMDVERTFFFVSTQAELAAVPIDDSPEEALLGSAHFDLAGLIEDEAILQLPISPRHAACAAIAGATTEAAVATDAAPPETQRPHPFAGLASLRTQLKARTPEADAAKSPAAKSRTPKNGASTGAAPRKRPSKAS